MIRLIPPRLGPRGLRTAVLALLLASAGSAARAVSVEFPGPVPVELFGDGLCATRVDFPDGRDGLLVGNGAGELRLLTYDPSPGVFGTLARLALGGEVAAVAPVPAADGHVDVILAAVRNPDRVVTVRVARVEPYLTVLGETPLDEDPGNLAFRDASRAAVTLPGMDRLVWLAPSGGVWQATGAVDTGDRPQALVATDLDGDGTREFAVANGGPLSRTVAVYRWDGAGYVREAELPLPAGPTDLAATDLDGDGRAELTVVSADTACAWTVADRGTGLAIEGSLDLTIPAETVHVIRLPGGSWGLYPATAARGLVEYYRSEGTQWVRRDGYYPGCRPVALADADLNGDDVPDLVSLGGSSRLATVMFGTADLGYWGFPALALPERPGDMALGDFDRDGHSDVVVMSSETGTLSFFRGRTDGGVAILPENQLLTTYPGPLAVGDLGPAPAPELAVHDRVAGQVRIFSHDSGGFVQEAAVPLAMDLRRFTAVDVDRDGNQDLLVLAGSAPDIHILFGDGSGAFPDSVRFGFENRVSSVVAPDLDGDGDRDLVGVDAVNRAWVALNDGGRSFSFHMWLNAGAGARSLTLGDMDGDGDEDVVVVGLQEATLNFLENLGDGTVQRPVGSLALATSPAGGLVEDVNQDGANDVVLNMRSAGTITVIYGLPGWVFTPPVDFPAGGDISLFATDDFNADQVPDILTLDASLRLGLTMLNVESAGVPVEPDPLTVSCTDAGLTAVVRPQGRSAWRLELEQDGKRRTVAADGTAVAGFLDRDGEAWRWREAGTAGGPAALVLTLGTGADLRIVRLEAGDCPGGGAAPPLAWSRAPWPNPFNPAVDARFVLHRPARVDAAVYDLRGRVVARLLAADLPVGEHTVHWDGTRAGRPAEAGVYLLRIDAGVTVITDKLMLLK